jgi:hypothetical protein
MGCRGHDGISKVTIVAMSNNAPRAMIPNLGYAYADMKGTVYGNRLPRGTQVEKSWETLSLSFRVYYGPRCASVSTCCPQMAGQFLFRHQR